MRGDKLAENLQTIELFPDGKQEYEQSISLSTAATCYEKKILGLTVASEFSSFCYGVSQVKLPVRPQWAPVHTETIHKEMILMGKARITFS